MDAKEIKTPTRFVKILMALCFEKISAIWTNL